MTSRKVVLLEYFLTESSVLIFGIRAGEPPQLVERPLDRTELRLFVENNFGGNGRVRRLKHLLAYWHHYDFLVAPVAAWAAPEDIVYLIPHGWLHYLPLHALKVEGRYLIERNPVVYGPSASVLRYCRAKREERRGRLNGGSVPPAAAVFGDSCGDDPGGGLPAARREAQAVAESFGARAFLGGEVTAEAFTRAVAGADLVHFAGHGDFHAADPLASGLRLAGGAKLTAREIFNLAELDASLVTLSGCETGVSANHPGDELIGLARAFLYAGTPSLLVSLWRVADDSTSFLMRAFYDAWRQSPPLATADALRRAMLQTSAHTGWDFFYHWAPFVLIGDWQ